MNQERINNKMLLKYFEDLRGIPQNSEDIQQYMQTRLNRPAASISDRAVKYLESAGYVERCEATAADEPMWKITAKGSQQALKLVPREQLDPMIWEDVR
jgi:hypothetical protein